METMSDQVKEILAAIPQDSIVAVLFETTADLNKVRGHLPTGPDSCRIYLRVLHNKTGFISVPFTHVLTPTRTPQYMLDRNPDLVIINYK